MGIKLIDERIDGASDAYLSLKDYIENCSSAHIVGLTGQILDASRAACLSSRNDDEMVFFTLFFDRSRLGHCLLHIGQGTPTSVALSQVDLRYLGSKESTLNRVIGEVVAMSLLKVVPKKGVLWLESEGVEVR